MKEIKTMIKLIGKILIKIKSAINYAIKEYEKSLFADYGTNIYIGKNCIFTHKNISIGTDVYVGANACFQSMHGHIYIGNHVMFGPGVHIHGGNHEFHVVGEYMKSIDKIGNIDGEIIIEDDVWIGANAIILTKVKIGRGSIIGAGSIVTKDIPPYSIYTGIPEKKLRKRFTDKEIEAHEQILKDRRLN